MPKKSTTKKQPVAAKKSVKQEAVKLVDAKPVKVSRYVEAVGRRKTAIARVRIWGGNGEFSVNGKGVKEKFPSLRSSEAAVAPIAKLKLEGKYNVSALVHGGGSGAQAEAVRLGLARALAVKNPDFKKRLRKLGFLTRDSRMVERKKYGLKKARRAPQWKKR